MSLLASLEPRPYRLVVVTIISFLFLLKQTTLASDPTQTIFKHQFSYHSSIDSTSPRYNNNNGYPHDTHHRKTQAMITREKASSAQHNNKEQHIYDFNNIRPNIVGGNFAPPDRYPYLVSLSVLTFNGSSQHACGGAFIAPDIVLTAGHCAELLKMNIRIEVLRYDRNSDDPFYVSLPREYFIHPRYYEHDGSRGIPPYDYAIYHIFGTVTRVPVLKINRDPLVPALNIDVTAVGWGDTVTGGSGSPILKETTLETLACSLPFADATLCANGVNTDTCQGDSGGPLLQTGNAPQEDIALALVSFGAGECANGVPSGYAKTSRGIEWITDMVCQYSSVPPDDFNCPNISRQPPDEYDDSLVMRLEFQLDFWPSERGLVVQSYNEDGFLVTNFIRDTYVDFEDDSTVIEEIILGNNNIYYIYMLDYYGDGDSTFPPSSITLSIDGEELGSVPMRSGNWLRFPLAELALGDPPTDIGPIQTPAPELSNNFITITILFDAYPQEVGYYVEAIYEDDIPQTVQQKLIGTYDSSYAKTRIEELVYLLPIENPGGEQLYRVTFMDSAADGLAGDAFYEVWVGAADDGILVGAGRFYYFEDTTFFLYSDDVLTASPTSGPTAIPTMRPTTKMPSMSPTNIPSSQPSVIPSARPSLRPSLSPSMSPSASPSNFPTTSQPSTIPTFLPSLSPSNLPSINPTATPSIKPSVAPSVSPSAAPFEITPSTSSSPSNESSTMPSTLPSTLPSTQPSKSPTTLPSSLPSRPPTTTPSTLPSTHPTGTPSLIPSVTPSMIPSSSSPSTHPPITNAATNFPSTSPSITPTPLQSDEPSTISSSSPSTDSRIIDSDIDPGRLQLSPSVSPSALPSNEPSFKPSQLPSSSSPPSLMPSDAQPVVAPTGFRNIPISGANSACIFWAIPFGFSFVVFLVWGAL